MPVRLGLFSSREITKALEELVPLRYLTAGNTPSHRALARSFQGHIDISQ
jgi:hypothetical protein